MTAARLRSFVPALLLALACVLPAAAQGGDPGRPPEPATPGMLRADPGDRMTLHAYTLGHRRAEEAAELVRGLLSPQGTVTVQPGSNTLVVRDTVATLLRVVPVLRRFDHPSRPLELEILVVRAFRSRIGFPQAERPPEELTAKLRKLLNYGSYQLLASADLPTREGEDVTYRVGDYGVSFRMGDLGAGRNVKLHDFQLRRGESDEPLIRTNLVLFMDKTYSLGFSRSEESETALMLVITCRRPAGDAGDGGDGRP